MGALSFLQGDTVVTNFIRLTTGSAALAGDGQVADVADRSVRDRALHPVSRRASYPVMMPLALGTVCALTNILCSRRGSLRGFW